MMSKPRLAPLITIAAVALGLLGPTFLSARQVRKEIDPRDRVLWANKDKQRPMFIPQSLLDRAPSELPLDESSRQALERRLEVQRHPELFPKEVPSGRIAECRQRPASPPPGSAENAMDLETLLSGKDVVWIGTVVDVEAGLDPRLIAAVEAADVKLEEVLQLKAGALAPASDRPLTVVFRGGSVRIGGTTLCDERPEGFYRPQVGDRILLGGTILPEEPRVFQGEVFALEGNAVQLEPYSFLQPDSATRDIAALRLRLREVTRVESKP